jgi:hypothetical protein
VPSTRAKPNLRRQIYLALVSKVEGQLRDMFTARNEECGLTQAAIAEKLNIHRSAVTRRLNGRSNMTLETVADMVWAVGGCIDVEIYDPASKPDRNHTLASETRTAWRPGPEPVAMATPEKARSLVFEGAA